MTPSYYDRDKHLYMQPGSGLFGDYVYSLISDESFSQYDVAIELGAGMGRFSASLVGHFSHVVLVEPAAAHVEHLNRAFSDRSVRVIHAAAEQVLPEYAPPGRPVVFCFHLMHHLTPDQRAVIYRFIRRVGAKGVFLEPNVYNPLIVLQILLHPDMSPAEEMQYVKLGRKHYERELGRHDLTVTGFRRLCFGPPIFTKCLLKARLRPFARFLEVLCRALPFVASYQLIVCEGK